MSWPFAVSAVLLATVSVSGGFWRSEPFEAASTHGQSVAEQALIGTVGAYSVGMHLTVRERHVFVAGHYFYARRAADIPLAGGIVGDLVTLREPGGGVFVLHLETGDRAAPHPLDFSNSTALVGTWTRGGRVLPVRLAFDFSGGPQGAERYLAITHVPATVFEGKVRRFLRGVATDNRSQVASATSFPLIVHGVGTVTLVVRNPGQFFARWRQVITPCLVAALDTAVPHEMFVRDGAAMVSNGAVWFDGKGAKILNVPSCKAG